MKKNIFSSIGIFFLLVILFIIIGLFLIDKNIFSLKTKLYNKFPNIELRLHILNKKSVIKNLKNDYNVKFLPFTQFEKFQYSKKKVEFENNLISKSKNKDKSISYKKYNSFFLDEYKSNIIITDFLGNVYFVKKNDLFSKKKEDLFANNILSDFKPVRVFDAFIYKDKIFISHTLNKKGCKTINISSALINYEKLNFRQFYKSNECNKTGSPGRIQFFQYNNIPGLLLSTSEGKRDKPGVNTQNAKSVYGKILFIPFNGSQEIIYSLGHRVIQGLSVYENIIIATEHGPRGGDEINLILNQKNYGWPEVSLGERYDFEYKNMNLKYKKNHKNNNFEEPIFSFIPSIGISEIVKLPSSFSIYYEDHYLLSSLNGGSLYFIRFDNNKSKIVTIERVFLNNRIRDVKILKNNDIILALEENAEIGILRKE